MAREFISNESPEQNNLLALLGGTAVRKQSWPKWPRANAVTQRNILDVLHSGKWTISGYSKRCISYEQKLGRAFAEYIGTSFCVPCSSGTAALTIALQALDIGPGDEVIVPGLTWVACASSVVNLGAVPIIVDVDPDSACLSVDSLRNAINKKTAAILMVHMYSSFCEIEAILDLAERKKVPVIEDCSQSHGASWKGEKVGRFGKIGVFSTQQSKLLTGGEGGLCVTNEKEIYNKMQQFRADGRMYKTEFSSSDRYEIEFSGTVSGQNLCMTEFSAAVLIEGLARLDQENQHRLVCYNTLIELLDEIQGVSPVACPDSIDLQTFYRLGLKIDLDSFNGLSTEEISSLLSMELKTDVKPPDIPMNRHPLYAPLKNRLFSQSSKSLLEINPNRFSLPGAEQAYETIITFPHQILLSDPSDMEDIVYGFSKIQKSSHKKREQIRDVLSHR